MYQKSEQRLTRLLDSGNASLLSQGGIGLEKESLRVSPGGCISQEPHPEALGSPLTHPYITTDYSEALTEFITPPLPTIPEAMTFLRDVQKFVYDRLEDEILWGTSMPCVIEGGENIPVAWYGRSNAGLMKTVYRRGLGRRYGRTMQVIAGAHFNYSLPEAFWPVYQEQEGDRRPLSIFVADAYFALLRNLLRFGWLIPYLFGASPAVCKSFLGGKPSRLAEFDESTYYEPYATSLRMGDIGYQNSKELGTGVKANYDGLAAYVASLSRAIETPCPIYEKLGVVVNGNYQQLNANILQIENEYYSTARPKQILNGNEKPIRALERRGVRYIELRSLDINAFHPLGISEEQLRFLEAFMIFCLLNQSPLINAHERQEIDRNQGGVAHRGRDPQLHLQRLGRELRLQVWARELCGAMEGVCEVLDSGCAGRPYGTTLRRQRELIEDPELTPSAQMLAEMRDRGEGFFGFAQRMSHEHRRYFESLTLEAGRERMLEQEALASWQRQREMEAADDCSFDEYLRRYFAQ